MDTTTQPILSWFLDHGFRLVAASSAISLLTHAELPGVEARIGTVYCVVERDGTELVRLQLRDFDVDIANERIFGEQPDDSG